MNIGVAIDGVQEAERDLSRRLLRCSQRHVAESDVYRQAQSRAEQSATHLERLRPFAERYGTEPVDDTARAVEPGPLASMREKASQLLARSEASGLVLVADLRDTYLAAQHAEIGWTLLLQSARAMRDNDLVGAATECHQQTELTAKWLRTKLKVAAPQAFAAGRPPADLAQSGGDRSAP